MYLTFIKFNSLLYPIDSCIHLPDTSCSYFKEKNSNDKISDIMKAIIKKLRNVCIWIFDT